MYLHLGSQHTQTKLQSGLLTFDCSGVRGWGESGLSGQHAEMYSRHVCPHLVTFHVHISKTQNIHHAIHLCARCCVAESMSLKKSGKKGIVIKIPPFFIYKNKQNKQILNSFFFFRYRPLLLPNSNIVQWHQWSWEAEWQAVSKKMPAVTKYCHCL